MPTDSSNATRPLPDRPNLRHLKDQAKDLLKASQATSLTEAAVQDRRALWVCQLAQAESSR